jgi:CRP-like cAMP-binding protein
LNIGRTFPPLDSPRYISAVARSDQFVETLATVPLFSACSKKELQLVAKSAERLTVPAGKVVFTEGAAGTEFFVIIDGRVRVERHGREVANLGPGAFFGDLAQRQRRRRLGTRARQDRPACVRRAARPPRVLEEAARRTRPAPARTGRAQPLR